MAPYDMDYRVETLIPNVVCGKYGTKLSSEQEETLKNVEANYNPSLNRQLCRACGWTDRHELTSSYLPRLRINHTRANAGLWAMGNDWIVWDCPDGERKNDYITHQFLRGQGTSNIPLVKEMVEFKDEDGQYNFLVMSRAKGVPLEHIWRTLPRAAKKSYVQQLAAALREMRQFTAEFPQRVDGSPLGDVIIAQCNSQKQCIKIGKTAEEWLDNMDEELREGISRQLQTRDKTFIEAKLQEIRKNFPDGAPFVLTHGDLNLTNILVHDGKIVAIIDWEYAGYYPWWVELYRSSYITNSKAGTEVFRAVWKELNESLVGVANKVDSVVDAWMCAPVSHSGRDHYWRRPPFCECQPFGGPMLSQHIDAEDKHYVDYDEVGGAPK